MSNKGKSPTIQNLQQSQLQNYQEILENEIEAKFLENEIEAILKELKEPTLQIEFPQQLEEFQTNNGYSPLEILNSNLIEIGQQKIPSPRNFFPHKTITPQQNYQKINEKNKNLYQKQLEQVNLKFKQIEFKNNLIQKKNLHHQKIKEKLIDLQKIKSNKINKESKDLQNQFQFVGKKLTKIPNEYQSENPEKKLTKIYNPQQNINQKLTKKHEVTPYLFPNIKSISKNSRNSQVSTAAQSTIYDSQIPNIKNLNHQKINQKLTDLQEIYKLRKSRKKIN